MNSAVPPPKLLVLVGWPQLESEAGVSTASAMVAVHLPCRPSPKPLGRPVSAMRPGPWLLSQCTYTCCLLEFVLTFSRTKLGIVTESQPSTLAFVPFW